MFAYCRNNPIYRIDISGTEDAIAYNDGELLSNEDLEERAKGGSKKSSTGNGGDPVNDGFESFQALKNNLGSPGEGNHWHHIVEQCQGKKSGFSSQQINNPSNVIAVDAQTHAKITGYYNTTSYSFTEGLSVRNWLAGKPYPVQYDFGIGVLKMFGVLK